MFDLLLSFELTIDIRAYYLLFKNIFTCFISFCTFEYKVCYLVWSVLTVDLERTICHRYVDIPVPVVNFNRHFKPGLIVKQSMSPLWQLQ